METVNHPAHYNKPGRKECIEEMLDIFGTEAVQAFCELNAYKYIYRSEMKGGQEDQDKAFWYIQKKTELIEQDKRFQIAKHYGLDGQLGQLIEEMAELTQAICKRNRGHNNNIVEEIADVRLVLNQVIFLLGCEKDVQEIENQKIERQIERMVEENAGN